MPVFNVRDFGARGDGSGDDTQAIVNAVSYLASQPNSFQNSLYLPAGRYLTSDGVAGYMNVQYLQLPSGSSGSFGVGVGGQYTGISITWSATDTAANATALQNALAAVGLVGTGNVTVTYDPVTTWYKIIFAVWLGGPYPSPDALVQPPPTLTPIFFRGNPNQQAIQITSASNGSFTLTVTVGTAAGMSTLTTSPAVNYLTGSGNTAANASAIQTALGGLTNVGSRNVACTYDSVKGYIVTFAPSLGAVVMTASSGNLTVSLTTFQSGAAIVIPNLFGLRIFGDGGALADYDQPAALVASSRSALVWNGTANGILLHLLGCNNTTIENLSIWGGTSQSSANQARTGLLLSASLANAAGQQGGSGLSCKTCVFTRFLSRPPTGTTFPPQAIGGCVQLGLNQTDPGADVTNYQATTFAHGTNGLVAVNQSSVNHYLSGCVISDLTTALWMQLGGGLSADGLKAESPGQSPMTVLQIGAGSSPYAYYGYGGGGNANTFLMRNVRTDLLSPSGYNITLVDATYASPGTQVTVDGWDDSQSNPVGPPIMFAQSMSGTSATSSVSVTLSVTAGDTLVAFGGAATTTNPSTTAVTDTNGNTWVFVTGSAVHSATTPAASGGAWYCKNANAGSTMITFAAPGTNCALTVHEYRNVDTVATLEASAAAVYVIVPLDCAVQATSASP